MSDLISPQEKEYLTKVITETFIQYDAQVDKKDLEVFCTNFVEQRDTIKDPTRIIGDVNRGLNTIDSLESSHRDLINAQKKGKSKLSWLKANIKAITHINDVRKIGEIVQSIQAELAKSNNQHLSSLLDENVEVFPEMPEREFAGINEQIAVQELLGEVQNNSLLTTISCAQQIESVVNHFNTNNENVSKVAKNCFEGELGNIGSVFGPVGMAIGAVGGAVVGRLAGNKIAQGIKTGITKIGQFAKKSVVTVVNKAKEMAQEVGKEVTKAAKKVKEFFANWF